MEVCEFVFHLHTVYGFFISCGAALLLEVNRPGSVVSKMDNLITSTNTNSGVYQVLE